MLVGLKLACTSIFWLAASKGAFSLSTPGVRSPFCASCRTSVAAFKRSGEVAYSCHPSTSVSKVYKYSVPVAASTMAHWSEQRSFELDGSQASPGSRRPSPHLISWQASLHSEDTGGSHVSPASIRPLPHTIARHVSSQ